MAIDLLREVATPELYRGNAFRLSGLPTDASARDIRRRADEVRAAERLGAPLARRSGLLPPDPEPEPQLILDALQRLRDPVRRVIEELFWFWPDPDRPVPLDPDEAASHWHERAEKGDALALHNLAVLTHARCLDVPLGTARRSVMEPRWHDAYTYWRKVRETDDCWLALVVRAQSLDDHRLTTAFIAELRSELPTAVLGAQATAAALMAESGHRKSAAWNADLVAESGFDDFADEALAAAAGPINAQIRQACERSERATPENSAVAARGLLDEVRVRLPSLMAILGAREARYLAAADHVALAVNGCAARYCNHTKDYRAGYNLVWRALAIEMSPQSRRILIDNLVTYATNIMAVHLKRTRRAVEKVPDGKADRVTGFVDTHLPRLEILRSLDIDAEQYALARELLIYGSLELLNLYATRTGDLATAKTGLRRLRDVAGDTSLVPAGDSLMELVGSQLEAFEAPDRCWFCDQRARRYCALKISLSGEPDRSAWPRVTWKVITVEVPRCLACRQDHLRPRATSILGLSPTIATVIVIVVGVVGALLLSAVNGFLAILALALSLALIIYAGIVRTRISRRDVTGSAAIRLRVIRTYPTINDLLKEGWGFGQHPPGI